LRDSDADEVIASGGASEPVIEEPQALLAGIAPAAAPIPRRRYHGVMRVLVSLLLCAFVAAEAAAQRRPNIVFVFSDDHAVQAISAYGSRVNRTPRIDQIAAQGALMLNSFCGNSICAPSRATVLTGKHSHANGKRTNLDRFDPDQVTFPKLLRNAGYQTALIGKWHLKADPQGFDHWEVLRGQGHYYNPDFRSAKGTRRIEGYATDVVTDLAIEWLETRDKDRPFVLMCQHKAPHRTWAPAFRHLEGQPMADLPEPATLFDDWKHRSPLLAKNEMSIRSHFYWDYDLKIPDSGMPDPFNRHLKSPETRRMTPAQHKRWKAAYAAENAAFLNADPKLEGDALMRWKYQRYIKDYVRTVAAVDDSVGRLLDWVDGQGLGNDTIFVYASDQGFYLGEHGWYDKRWMFEESFRMPLLIRWPQRIRPGTRVEAMVQNIDYAPTFLAAAGVEIPKEIQGRSMLPVLTDRPTPWRDQVWYAYYEEGEHAVPRHEGVRTRRHKLMYLPGPKSWQLFDLETDPHEMKSVAGDPSYAAVLADMKRRLRAARLQYDANPWPLPAHDTHDVRGWKVHVDEHLLVGEGEALGRAALRALDVKLGEITLTVPGKALARLREVPIWLDARHKVETMCYHPSAGWLRDNGHAVAMEKSVHIPRAAKFVELCRTHGQPSVILHEMAHAFHDRVLGFDHLDILKAWKAAVSSGRYKDVRHMGGGTRKHYALKNHKEWFAEMTEAWLGTNDFWPFVRGELLNADPQAAALLKTIWGR